VIRTVSMRRADLSRESGKIWVVSWRSVVKIPSKSLWHGAVIVRFGKAGMGISYPQDGRDSQFDILHINEL